jgi:hypothetical protein
MAASRYWANLASCWPRAPPMNDLDSGRSSGEESVPPIQSKPEAGGAPGLEPNHVPPALEWAWDRYDLYDSNAVRIRKAFQRLQLTILVVAVGTTLLALTEATLVAHHAFRGSSVTSRTMHILVLFFPIALATLLGIASRFRTGSKWVDLRTAAEGVKREVFLYRTQTGPYAPRRTTRVSRDQLLSHQVAAIGRAIMQTEVSRTPLRDPPASPMPTDRSLGGSRDDGFRDLASDAYISHRVDDQIEYFGYRATRLARVLWLLLLLIFLAGGVGTLLAALHIDIWIAMTTAVVGAVTTYLGYEQVESTLVNYNQARKGLISLNGWRITLPAQERGAPETREQLVSRAERVLQKEHGGWVADMTDALAELRAEEEQKGKRNTGA